MLQWELSTNRQMKVASVLIVSLAVKWPLAFISRQHQVTKNQRAPKNRFADLESQDLPNIASTVF
jgi:hypothetical protein